MSREEALKFVRRLLAGYPQVNLHDPQGYVAALVEVMEQYPAWAGQAAILKVDEEHAQFPPSDRTLRKWLEEAVSFWRANAERNRRIAKQLAEREPDEPAPKCMGVQGDGGPGTIYDYRGFHDAVAKHGRPRGPFE